MGVWASALSNADFLANKNHKIWLKRRYDSNMVVFNSCHDLFHTFWCIVIWSLEDWRPRTHGVRIHQEFATFREYIQSAVLKVSYICTFNSTLATWKRDFGLQVGRHLIDHQTYKGLLLTIVRLLFVQNKLLPQLNGSWRLTAFETSLHFTKTFYGIYTFPILLV